VVSIRSSMISEVTMFRSRDRRCDVVRPSLNPATLWRMKNLSRQWSVVSCRFSRQGHSPTDANRQPTLLF
jgi:D-tyrosyl-tRNA(Tyr) deacylase